MKSEDGTPSYLRFVTHSYSLLSPASFSAQLQRGQTQVVICGST